MIEVTLQQITSMVTGEFLVEQVIGVSGLILGKMLT